VRRVLVRLLARLVLIGSIAPVIVFGPALVRAPVRLWHVLALVRAPVAPWHELAVRTPSACAGRAPRALRLTRLHGPRVRLSWRMPAGTAGKAPLAYRVLRSGRTVGQTHHRAMVLRITPGRATTFTIQARYAAAPLACPATLHSRLAFRAPGRVQRLRVLARTAGGVSIGWQASARGDAPVAGYRIWRDSAVAGQTRLRTFALRLSPARSQTVKVAAVDTRGNVGSASATLVIPASRPAASPLGPAKRESKGTEPPARSAEHTPPQPPSLLAAETVTDTSATLAWTEGSTDEGTVAGYLLSENGVTVGVVHGQRTTVALASAREYTFTVQSMDATGALSIPSPELKVLTTHTPPPAPTSVSAADVTSQSALVSWEPSTAVSGRIVGYRVFRNGIPVGQTATTEMTLASLAPSSEYTVTVVAVDSLDAISPPSSALDIHTAPPPPTHGSVQAYVLASTDRSFADLQAHYQQVGVVYPTYYDCGPGGAVLGHGDPLITGWANARQIAVMPRINCQNPVDEEQVLNEPAATQSMIEQLAALCQSEGYAGVQIDFEGAPPAEREPFTAFITALAERLHAQGDKLSTVVTAKASNAKTGRAAMYNDAALSGPSDYMVVLDWGLHWTTSRPGSIDELPWFTKIANYTATLPNRSKFVLAMPLYGIDWPSGGGSEHPGTPLEFSSIVALENELGIVPEWEATAQSPHFSYVDGAGVNHEVWYVDQQSLAARAAVATSLGMGIALWRLGEEDQSVWELPVLGWEG
jgi:spore germination protein YaaH